MILSLQCVFISRLFAGASEMETLCKWNGGFRSVRSNRSKRYTSEASPTFAERISEK